MKIRYEQDEFILPAKDVCMLPIAHSSAEELARFIWGELHDALKARDALADIVALEVSVAEGPGQSASYSRTIPKN